MKFPTFTQSQVPFSVESPRRVCDCSVLLDRSRGAGVGVPECRESLVLAAPVDVLIPAGECFDYRSVCLIGYVCRHCAWAVCVVGME